MTVIVRSNPDPLYFPRRSRLNQTNQLFLEDILLESKEASCSFEGDVTTDH